MGGKGLGFRVRAGLKATPGLSTFASTSRAVSLPRGGERLRLIGLFLASCQCSERRGILNPRHHTAQA